MRREPNLTPETKFAMYNPSAGCVCPYGLTIAYAENAVQNGAQVSLNTAVLSMAVSEHNIISVTTNRGVIHPKIVINAAGVFAEDIAAMADDRFSRFIRVEEPTRFLTKSRRIYALGSLRKGHKRSR